MSCLITHNTLFREADYTTGDHEKVSKFWQVGSGKTLLECGKGRIREEQSTGPGETRRYIELIPGNIQLYVAKNADIGKVERGLVSGVFLASFNLLGTVANGITFSSQNLQHSS